MTSQVQELCSAMSSQPDQAVLSTVQQVQTCSCGPYKQVFALGRWFYLLLIEYLYISFPAPPLILHDFKDCQREHGQDVLLIDEQVLSWDHLVSLSVVPIRGYCCPTSFP